MIYVPIFIIGIVFVIGSLQLGLGTVQHPGKGFLPFYTGAALTFVSFFCLIKYFLKARGENDKSQEKHVGQSASNVIIIVVALFIYVLVLQWLGYLLSTFLLLTVLFAVAGFRKWVFIVIYAFITTSLSYLIFSYSLNLRFPKGILGL